MHRRPFLGTLAAGLTASFSPASLRRLEAAASRTTGRTPEEVAGDESFWREVQQSFSVSRNAIYLNSAGVSPAPQVVTDAVVHHVWEQEKVPAYTLFTSVPADAEPVRAALAKLIGADSEEVAITRNATDALDTVLLGVPLQPGDEVLTTTQDYWAMLDALEQRRLREGIVLKKVRVPTPPDGMGDLLQAFERGISPRTKLILVSHPVNLTGQLFPVKEICDLAHARGVEVLVDGAQSLGHIELKQSDLGCDYYGASLHKWLMAPKETGMLYVRREKIEKVWPLLPAPESIKRDNIRKFEAFGTRSSLRLAVAEALAFHNGVGGARKEARLRYLARYWVDRLKGLPNLRYHTSFKTGMSCGIATVDVVGVDSAALWDHLWTRHRIFAFDVARRTSEFQGIRISPNLHTTLEELDQFCDVMERVSKNGIQA